MFYCILQISTKSLETLNLGHNNLTNEGIHRLKEGLLQNKSLLRVGIQACKVTCEGLNSHSIEYIFIVL